MEELIKRLSTETQLSYNQARVMVEYINSQVGNIETAHKIYKSDGVRGLETYAYQLKLGVKY